jgi:hypothetical protein
MGYVQDKVKFPGQKPEQQIWEIEILESDLDSDPG